METTAKTQTKRDRAINHFVEKLGAAKDDYFNYIFLYYLKEKKMCVAIFAPRGYKTEYHYSFQTAGQADDFVIKQKARILKQHEQDQKNLLQYEEEKKGFEVGKILVSSWGYEQTNVDFYLITSRKNDFITIQEIGEKRNYEGQDDRGTVMPDTTVKKGEPLKKKISKYASVKLQSYKYCRLWDGKPEYFTSYA